MRTLLLLLAVVVAGNISSTAYGQAAVTRVRVLDVLGDPVSGASVVVTSGDAVVRVVLTGPDGRADVGGPSGLPAGPGVAWLVSAPGFGDVRADAPSSATGEVVVTVRPAARSEDVTVTAGRRAVRGAELPADATVLSRRDLEVTAAGTLDDVLRLTPGFSLFRRSSSRTSNPTTQGVTLRGLSASGASRTLVLADGVPLNDPFGGWVSWNRVPQVAIDRVEVVRGGASDLYGADAAGGVIQLLSVEPVSTVVRALVEGGGQGSGRLSTLVGSRRGSWSGSVSAERTTTDGAIPIAPEVRGPIDTEAGMDSGVVAVHATGTVAGAWRASIRGQVFDEDRKNGTLLQDNDTNQRQASADLAGFGRWGDLRVRAFSAGQGYDQAFSAVNASRSSETLSSRQRVASTMDGGAVEYVRAVRAVTLLAGGDVRQVEGDVIETRPMGAPTLANGRQTFAGGFAQGTWAPSSRWVVVTGGRADRVNTASEPGGERNITAFSPKASVVYTPGAGLTARASVYRAFRAPTLNERLRSFRVGNALTQNNPALDPERVAGGDASLAWERRRTALRATVFSTRLDDAVTNVTISSTPTLITRQRRNAGRIASRGLELEGRVQVVDALSVAGTLAWTRARFASSDEPGLAGNRVPQVPTAQGALDVRWQPIAPTLLALQVRWTGPQFDDDRNAFTLRRSQVADLLGEHRITGAVRGFVAAENLFDADYDVGRTPLRTVGTPRRVRAGLRLVF